MSLSTGEHPRARTMRSWARARTGPGTVGAGWALLGFAAVIIASTLLGPLIAAALGLDGARTTAPAFSPPGEGMPLGTDKLGRDVTARVLTGGAELLGVAALSTLAAMLVGVALGLALALSHRLARWLMVLIDTLVVLPSIITMMVLIYGLGGGLATIVLVMTVVSAPFIARYTRTLTAQVAGSEYVLMARLAGDSAPRIAVREILPNLTGPLLTETGYRFIGSLYLVAAAGFLGLQPLETGSDWATMVAEGLPGIALNPWASLAPALAIAAVTIPVNLLLDRTGAGAR